MTRAKPPQLADLHLDPANANKGTGRGRALVESSLAECGAGRSILADKDGTILAGNKTWEAARRLGLPIRVVETAGDELVVVKRTDLALNQDERARRLAYLDNRASELGLEWDLEQLLADSEAGLDLESCGFSPADLAALLSGIEARPGLTGPDEVPELPEEPVSQAGDLWLLGPHRVLCGDSTSAANVSRLLSGASPFLMVTDPPYGVDYDPAWRNRAGLSHTARTGKVENDDRAGWREAYELFPGGVAYVWHGGLHAGDVFADLGEAGFSVRSQVIWAKPHFVISRGHYHWGHEPCFYAVRNGRSAKWTGSRTQSTLWEVTGKDGSEPTVHGTQKPVELMSRAIRNHGVPADAVYDPFLGSGTTLIAAEQLGRRCFGLEIDPRYVDVIVRRWENFSGHKTAREQADG